MDQFDQYFTPEEANQVLLDLTPNIEDLMETRERIVEIRPELDIGLKKALGNGGSRATGELMALMRRVRRILEQIQARGVLVKDIDQGLLDFPAEHDGRVVFLCWKYGEAAVEFWHDLDAGFAGRQPL